MCPLPFGVVVVVALLMGIFAVDRVCCREGEGSAAAGERGVEQWREEGGRGDIRWGVG